MINDIEQKRIVLQASLDVEKTQAERNRLGQFATPAALAKDIIGYAARLLPRNEKVSFLDPAIGTGSFYSALLKVFPENRIERPSASRSTLTMESRQSFSGKIQI